LSVWFAIPSKRPDPEAQPVLDLWRERGYLVALFRDAGDPPLDCHFELRGVYPGYAAAVNRLCREILAADPQAEWIVHGGDDVAPDSSHSADEIAVSCLEHFGCLALDRMLQGQPCVSPEATFGVMQPTGDRWGDEPWSRQRWPERPAYIDRICGSPWVGREFARRMYGGRGPLCEAYHHMFEDEELQNVAEDLGVLWQRRDLVHHHGHWGRKPNASDADCPEFLRAVAIGESGRRHWAESQTLFNERKAAGFPGHEPIL